jgi:hypothetical protein
MLEYSKEQLFKATLKLWKLREKSLTQVNAYTQYDYKYRKNVSYDAIMECFERIKVFFTGKRIGIPKIGAGLAGGDWKLIYTIIDNVMADEDITLVEYEN